MNEIATGEVAWPAFRDMAVSVLFELQKNMSMGEAEEEGSGKPKSAEGILFSRWLR